MSSSTNNRRLLLFVALPIAALTIFFAQHFRAVEPTAGRKGEPPVLTQTPPVFSDQKLPVNTPSADIAVPNSTASKPDPAPTPSQPTREEISSALVGFTKWAEVYAVAPADKKLELVAKGLPLAEARGRAMAALIKQDPQAAIESLLPYPLRKALPTEIASRIEHRVSGVGDLEVIGVTPLPGQVVAEPIYRNVKLANKKYRAYVYGSRKNDISRSKIRILGVGIKPLTSEALLAVREDAYEVLNPAEANDLDPDRKQASCPISKNPTNSENNEIAVDIANKIIRLCSPAHFPKWLKTPDGELVLADGGRGNGMGGVFESRAAEWTNGYKKFLMIRVRFQNQGDDKVHSEGNVKTWLDEVVKTLPKWSYGKMTASFECTPLIQLDHDEGWYGDKENFNEFTMLEEARIKAYEIIDFSGNRPYDPAKFDFDGAVFTAKWGDYGGLGRLGNKGIYVKSAGAGVMLHEWGHNFGLQHANGWRPITESPIGDGIAEGYANKFSTMGDSSKKGSYTTQERLALKWLLPDNAATVTTSGTYDLYNPDVDSLSQGRLYALQLRKFEMDYLIEYRPSWGRTNNPMQNTFGTDCGAMFLLQSDQLQLDMTPSSKFGFNDPALLVGHSFYDPNYGVTVTPLARGGTAPNDYLKLRVNFDSPQANNPPDAQVSASTISPAVGQSVDLKVTASDPDGDTLAYAWDFGDGGNLSVEDLGKNMSADNLPIQRRSWTTAGVYNVRCTVSDMKGKTCVKSLLVRVGSPSTFTISGRITQPDGTPVQNVLVNEGTIARLQGNQYGRYSTYTDANGFYSIGPLSNGNYTIYAVREGWQLSAPSSGSVSVTDNVVNFNFTATQPLEQSGITLEHWSNVTGDKLVSLIPRLSDKPDSTRVLTRLFEVVPNIEDNYGQRLRGYFIPPTTGNYTFYISSNDQSELYLSTNSLAENKKPIARVESYNFYPHSWTGGAGQKSAAIPLSAGQRYYIEALHKEGINSDHLSVGADFPGGIEQFPIHATYLRPMSSPVIPVIPVTGGPAGFTWCANEGGSYSLAGPSDVAYGGDGKFIYRYNQTGTVTFNNGVFGDPAPGVTKGGFYKIVPPSVVPVPPPGYTWCASEGGSYSLSGLSDVAYGGDGKFNYFYNQTGTVTFNNALFGDPAPGVTKSGFYKIVPPPVVPVGPPGYIWCATEWGNYSLSVPSDVAYGGNGKFEFKYNQTGNVSFNNFVFGDPAPGVVKSGFYKILSQPVGPPGYTWCASEWDSYALSGPCDVAYGGDGQFKYLYNRTGTITYTNSTFDGDPLPGAKKNGFYKLRAASFASWSRSNGLVPNVNGDSDLDGIPNVVEYALQPGLNGAGNSFATYHGNVVSYTKGVDASNNNDVDYCIEASSDLGVTDPWHELPSTDDGTKIEAVMPSGAKKVFVRLRVVLITP
jgi:PKD domain/Carboxypeptidase regulatory-like domain/PA14 domain